MVRSHAVLRLALLALVVACQDSPFEPAPSGATSTPDTATASHPTPVVGLVGLGTPEGGLDLVGASRRYYVTVFDRSGAEIDPTGLEVTSSNPGVAVVTDANALSHYACDSSVGTCRTVWEASALVQEVGAGTASISASLRGVASNTVELNVRSLPTVRADLVIDSFTVVEYRPTCSWECPYHAYVPWLRLREPSGASGGEVLRAIDFTVPTLSTGLCQSDGPALAPGELRQVNPTFDPYLWNNDFFLVDLAGPVPDGQATVRVIVESPEGELRTVEATAPIVRNGTPPLGSPSQGCGY